VTWNTLVSGVICRACASRPTRRDQSAWQTWIYITHYIRNYL